MFPYALDGWLLLGLATHLAVEQLIGKNLPWCTHAILEVCITDYLAAGAAVARKNTLI